MLTPEQQADYDYAMSLLEKKEVGKIAFATDTKVSFWEKCVRDAAGKLPSFTMIMTYDDEFNFKINNEMMKAFSIPSAIFQGEMSAQDSNRTSGASTQKAADLP